MEHTFLCIFVYIGVSSAIYPSYYGYSSPYNRIRHQKHNSGIYRFYNRPQNQRIILDSPPPYFNPFYTGQIETVQQCPEDKQCSSPLDPSKTLIFRCFEDQQCPENFQCCFSSCFQHKVCRPAVSRWQEVQNITTEAAITQATTVFTPKHDKEELVQQCPQDKQCSDPLDPTKTLIFRCFEDEQCPQNCKCCSSSCFHHNVCRPAVLKWQKGQNVTTAATPTQVTIASRSRPDMEERQGTCPFSNECTAPLDIRRTYIFKCTHDSMCPTFYKCCPNSCFVHKVCRPAHGGFADNATETPLTTLYPFYEPKEVTDPVEDVTEPEYEATEPADEVTEPVDEVTEPEDEVTEAEDEETVDLTQPTTEVTDTSTEDNGENESNGNGEDNDKENEGENTDGDTNENNGKEEDENTGEDEDDGEEYDDGNYVDYDDDKDNENDENSNEKKDKKDDKEKDNIPEEDEVLVEKNGDKRENKTNENNESTEGSGDDNTVSFKKINVTTNSSRGDTPEEYDEYYDEDFDYIKRK